MIWTDFLRKLNPSKQQAIHQTENMMLATQKIKTSLSSMEKKQKAIEEQIETATKQIRAYAKGGDKRNATATLLKRRRLCTQQAKIFNTIYALETQLDTIDATETNTALLDAFKSSSSAFRKWKENNPIKNTEDVEAIKQDLEDQIQNSNDILDIVSQPMNLRTEDVTSAMEDIDLEDIIHEIDECEEKVQHTDTMVENNQKTGTDQEHQEKIETQINEAELQLMA